MPKGRHNHASGIISGLLSSTLIVMGGVVDKYQVLNDRCCWLFDCNSHEWTKVIIEHYYNYCLYILQIDLPHSVSDRYDHSLSVFTVGLNCV